MALDPPAQARAEIAAWRDGLTAARADIRPVPEGSLHVTLVFLGYLPEKRIGAVEEAMRLGCRDAAAARLVPAAIRALPPRSPRLFALDLEDEGKRCASLQASTGRALADAGLHTPERRPFWPHVTLARVKRGARAAPLDQPRALPGPFAAGAVVLYRSTLRPQGALYEPLAEVSLRA